LNQKKLIDAFVNEKICLGGIDTQCKAEILNKEDEETYFYKVIENNKLKPKKRKNDGRGRGKGKKMKKE